MTDRRSAEPLVGLAAAEGAFDSELDVVVIGAGVNGSGVARDCALRGLSVAVLERNDVGFGASGNSSGMIHGGPRYLTHDPGVTHSSCLDSGHIQRIAPHLLFRIPFLMPVHADRPGAKGYLTLLDAFFDLYDRYQPLKRGKPHTRLSAAELCQLEPGLMGKTVGGVSFDEWGIDGVRLCVANLVDASERGARVHLHTTVTEVVRGPGGAPRGVRYRNLLSGRTGQLRTKLVVNATGAWSPLTTQLSGLAAGVRLRPGKGTHVYFDRRLTNYAIAVTAVDGRQVFLEPWQNMTVIGTTDDDYYGDLDDVVATTDEVRYLIEAVARVFPAIRSARAIGTWSGVRPTLYEWGKPPDDLSREHRVVDHAEQGADGLYSMIGGKLASYRQFSEEMTDILARRLGSDQRATTHTTPLPGGEETLDPLALSESFGIDAVAAARLEYRHGARAPEVLVRLQRNPSEAAIICPCEPVLEAEVRYVVDREWARTVDDVARRTRLGLGACGGMRCAVSCGAVVAQMTGASPADGRTLAAEFLHRAARRRLSAVGTLQARQEALSLATQQAHLPPLAAAQAGDACSSGAPPVGSYPGGGTPRRGAGP